MARSFALPDCWVEGDIVTFHGDSMSAYLTCPAELVHQAGDVMVQRLARFGVAVEHAPVKEASSMRTSYLSWHHHW